MGVGEEGGGRRRMRGKEKKCYGFEEGVFDGSQWDSMGVNGMDQDLLTMLRDVLFTLGSRSLLS